MKDQHKLIKGYRDLTEMEIGGMNEAKSIGIQLGNLIESLRNEPDIDKRWLGIAEEDLQKGIMSLVRSIARPTVF